MPAPLQSIVSGSGMNVQDAIRRIHGAAPDASGYPVQRSRPRPGWLLFGQGHRHVSAADLCEEATCARARLPLTTVYDTLRRRPEPGMVRQAPTGGGKAFFDANAQERHHDLAEGEGRMWRAPPEAAPLAGKPVAPEGHEVAGSDVIVRLRRPGDAP